MRSLLAVTLLTLTACPLDDSADPVVDPAPDPAALVGTYQVTSHFEVPATVIAPGPLGTTLELIHQLSVNPAGAILDEAAGGLAFDALRAVLPDALEGELEGWMNGHLDAATVDGQSPHGELVELDALLRSVLLDWELRSTLALPATGPGTHAPIALVFSAGGEPIVVPVDETAPVTAGTDVTATVAWPAGGGEPQVLVGDHFMGVPFGRYALTALESELQGRYGADDIAGALGTIVDCAGMAESVAGRCVGIGIARICVGHAEELTAVCAAGLAAAAGQLEEQILSVDYKAIHFVSGTATVEGAERDEASATATGSALTNGSWTSVIDLKQVPQEATASYSAARQGP